jgi:hypothetical protein
MASGILIQGLVGSDPASSMSTRISGSSVSRLASTQAAVPPPTMM